MTSTQNTKSTAVSGKPIHNEGKNVAISFHSRNYEKAKELGELLRDNGYTAFLISEGSPLALALREQTVSWCDLFVMVVSFNYQRAPYCTELANYAKDKKKPVVSVIIQHNYSPSGCTGAIAKAWGSAITQLSTTQENMQEFLDAVKEKLSGVEASSVAMPTHDKPEGSALKTEKTGGSGVCISYHPDGQAIAGLVRHGKGVSNYNAQANSMSSQGVVMGDPSDSNLEKIKACSVFVPILTPGFQESSKHQQEYEFARANQKQIIPVKGAKFWPTGWLAVGIAGKLYYEMLGQQQAYNPYPNVPDSTPMNDFIFAVMTALEGEKTEEEREKAEIQVLTKELEQYKSKLHSFPPPPRDKSKEVWVPLPSPEQLRTNDTENLRFMQINYTITRMTFDPPKPLFDKYGLPIEQKFDIMLSYNWGIQSFVREVYMELSQQTFQTWMDIWGGMQGNINEAMATAVENSTMLVAFLTEKYQQSVNCNLELKYATMKEKPIIFIKAEKDLVLKDWIQQLVDKSVVFEMSSSGDFKVEDKGVPKAKRLGEAARNIVQWAAKQPKLIRKDVSEEVYKLQDMLEDARCAFADQESRKRFETCTRCEARFDPTVDKSGCKRHRAYYMGGNIIAGRWVCCSQRGKETLGCEPCDHFTTQRKWEEMAGFGGCFQFNPK
ncbi:predicted protein [Nematostella vectensis]|uniref:TIR domain-containing protein n=1 Tax=Nematostella vectensis TaxID=45351 RepID=A7ST59_NEMVE|nr:predicted protein [Nematostella vectensis]|eukprot:XP_001625205.1 predicted protein [Nematostella vectensis]